MIVSPSEHATILAALRYFQDEFQTAQPGDLVPLFPQFESAAPLTAAEIDSLCERLNMPEPAEGDEPCDCEGEGFFHAGVPGILAHLQQLLPGLELEKVPASHGWREAEHAEELLEPILTEMRNAECGIRNAGGRR